jgi:hypothetical protein
MPWEQPLNQILQSVQGPVAKILAVIIIIMTGLTLAFGDTSTVWVAKYKSGGDRSLKQTAAMWPPRVTVKRGWNG